MLSHKHYQIIAEVLNSALLTCEDVGDDATVEFISECIVEPMTLIFKLDNPSFDADRFTKACGVKQEA